MDCLQEGTATIWQHPVCSKKLPFLTQKRSRIGPNAWLVLLYKFRAQSTSCALVFLWTPDREGGRKINGSDHRHLSLVDHRVDSQYYCWLMMIHLQYKIANCLMNLHNYLHQILFYHNSIVVRLSPNIVYLKQPRK